VHYAPSSLQTIFCRLCIPSSEKKCSYTVKLTVYKALTQVHMHGTLCRKACVTRPVPTASSVISIYSCSAKPSTVNCRDVFIIIKITTLERSRFHCPLPPFTILNPLPSLHRADVERPQVLFNGTKPRDVLDSRYFISFPGLLFFVNSNFLWFYFCFEPCIIVMRMRSSCIEGAAEISIDDNDDDN